ncbi:uncharacterized protein METZ01_LOCUS420599 [marine metagenome]|uniref:Uncharacterized protein n=1 Tax=marine metagenome TaxID=408172 RepID=A0A382XAX7_9ZZZZ
MFTITTASAGWFSKESELMYTLNKIESKLDLCIETQDKAYCWQVSRGHPFMSIPLNSQLSLELDNCILDITDPSYECEATRLRIWDKFIKAHIIAGPDMELLDDKEIINE